MDEILNRRWRAAIGVLACLGLAVPAVAGTFNISPIRAQLSGNHRTAVLTLTNADDEPVVVQVQVFAWTQKDGEEHLDETRDVLVTPPVMQIPAKTAQIVRVALRRDPDPSQELSYRVVFEEVPQASVNLSTTLRVALRLSVPIFVSPVRGNQSPSLSWESNWLPDGKLDLAAVNRGGSHVQVTDFDVVPAGAKEPVHGMTSKYVLPGSRMSWILTPGADADRHGALAIHGHSDQGDFTADIAASGRP